MKLVLCCFLMLATSCSLFPGFSKRPFTYNTEKAQTADAIKVLVPRGYLSEKIIHDSSGLKVQQYRYADGPVLYVAYTSDTLTQIQPIDETKNIPLPHPFGGWIYKGQDANGLFWREIRQDSLRFGYFGVPTELEIKFDSALNYAGYRRGQR